MRFLDRRPTRYCALSMVSCPARARITFSGCEVARVVDEDVLPLSVSAAMSATATTPSCRRESVCRWRRRGCPSLRARLTMSAKMISDRPGSRRGRQPRDGNGEAVIHGEGDDGPQQAGAGLAPLAREATISLSARHQPKGQQHAEQEEGHRDRRREDARQQVREGAHDGGEVRPSRDEDLHHVRDLVEEQDEREQEEAEAGGRRRPPPSWKLPTQSPPNS